MVRRWRFKIFAGSGLVLGLMVAGCATRSDSRPAGAVPRSVGTVPGGPAGSATVPAGYAVVWVESVPAGGTVVLNGVPVGPAPQRLTLPVSARGFSRGEMSIRVRFVGNASGEASASVEERLNGTDRMPSRLRFTPERVQRIP